jgi:hypothetical protein
VSSEKKDGPPISWLHKQACETLFDVQTQIELSAITN